MEPLEQLDEVFELDSDQECDLRPIDSDDSDDDFSQDLVERLQRFDSQRQSPRRRKNTKAPVEDEFERTVNAELSASLAEHCRRLAPHLVSDRALPAPRDGVDSDPARPLAATAAPNTSGDTPAADSQGRKQQEEKKKPEQEYYDDVYFDSDDDSAPEDAAETPARTAEDNGTAHRDVGGPPGGAAGVPPAANPGSKRSERRRNRRRRPVLTNDQLLYDPEQDERDQQWVDRQRRRYQPAVQTSGSGNLQSKPGKLPHSDAVLNCPACMTMLCLDCQRHELYSNQYRAMFVFNCDVDASQALRYRLKEPSRRRGRRGAGGGGQDGRQSPPATAQELFNPVKCATCKTEVAVYDSDEVYHFFNVIASHS